MSGFSHHLVKIVASYYIPKCTCNTISLYARAKPHADMCIHMLSKNMLSCAKMTRKKII